MDYKLEMVIPMNPPPHWHELSPTGFIPALTQGDFNLTDSTVICEYLDQLASEPSLYPTEAKKKAKARWYEEYVDSSLSVHVIELFHEVIGKGVFQGLDVDHEKVDTINANLPEKLDYLESQLTTPYFMGDEFTVADIALVSNLINYQYVGFTLDAESYPNLVRHYNNVVTRPKVRKTLDEEIEAARNMGLNPDFLVN